MSERRYNEDGWPVDEAGKRTDPIGRYFDSLTPEQRQAWDTTSTANLPRMVIEDGRVRTIYPWEPGFR